jgi:TolB-like protein
MTSERALVSGGRAAIRCVARAIPPGGFHTLPSKCRQCGTPTAADAVFCSKCGLNFTLEQSAIPKFGQPVESDTLSRLRTALSGRYLVERELGAGGMATVFLAQDVKHGREVAIKVLHPDLAASLGAERFEREIRLAAKLQHPHILGLYDSGADNGLLYYVMPFVKGESLRDRIVREGMLPVEDAIRVTLEVCGALGYAHEHGIVHRDIKPENILISSDHALVADFGIARAVGEAGSGGQKLTQTGMSLGTPVYMAPEQSTGEAAGPTADLYSLACVLYEMLAGEPPFTGTTPMAIMKRHLMEQVPSVRIVRDSVPEEVEQVIFAALSKNPVDRPQSAEQFAELMGLPLGSTATMRVMRTSTGARRIVSGVQFAVPAPAIPWWRGRATMAVAGVVVIAAAVGVWAVSGRKGASSGALGPDARRIAVMYFDDQSKDHSLRPLADGLTEGLMQSLSSAASLTVISRSGVEQFRGTTVPVDSVARALRAGYIVRGEVEPEGNNVRVSVRLLDASGATIKRGGFAVPSGEVLRMRDSVAQVAATIVREELAVEIRASEQRASTSNQTAWLLVQRGDESQKRAEEFYAKGDSAGASAAFTAADSLFAAAQKEDQKWAEPATLRAAEAERRSRIVGRDPAAIRPWVELGLKHADTALARDPNSADALEARGKLRYWSWLSNLETDAAKKKALLLAAKADLEKATTLNRNQAGAWATLSHLHYQIPTCTTNDVMFAAQSALAADEFLTNANIVLARLFLAAYDLGQFDAAQQHCDLAHKRFPTDPRATRCQLYLLTTPKNTAPDVTAAWRLADSLVAMVPSQAKASERLTANMLVAAVIARASKGRPELADSARHVARRSEGDAVVDQTRELAYRGAFVYTLLGDKAEAIRLLKAYLAVNPQRIGSLRDDPGWWFRDLRDEPGFRQLVGAAN